MKDLAIETENIDFFSQDMTAKEQVTTNVEQATTFIFYRCHSQYCNTRYAVEEEATEEPCCPTCGGYYFSVIAEHSIKI